MVVIGLVIGGIFGGMRLIENARTQKTIQLLTSVEAATLIFQSTYGRPPGDFAYPSQRLRDCTALPCSRAGNGNRTVGTFNNVNLPANPTTTENYAFWHHLVAADLIDLRIQNNMNFAFGSGQPRLPLSPQLGLRAVDSRRGVTNFCAGSDKFKGTSLVLTPDAGGSVNYAGELIRGFQCNQVQKIDIAIDDGLPLSGRFQVIALGCHAGACNATYTGTDSYVYWGVYGFK